jgi:hypothetical protein
MIASVLAFLMKLGLGGIADKAIGLLETKAKLANNTERLKSETTVVLAKEAVNEAKIMAEFNTAKLSFPWFWILASMFVVPLALWWAAVILDSIFFFTWDVADLPTPQMQQWAGDMIRWLFYVGSGVGALKTLK